MKTKTMTVKQLREFVESVMDEGVNDDDYSPRVIPDGPRGPEETGDEEASSFENALYDVKQALLRALGSVDRIDGQKFRGTAEKRIRSMVDAVRQMETTLGKHSKRSGR